MRKLRPWFGISRSWGFPALPPPYAPPPPPQPGHSSACCPTVRGSQARAAWDSRGTPPSGQPPRAAPPSLAARGPVAAAAHSRGEPATEGGGREGATEAGRGVGESSRAVYGLSEAADLRGGNRCSLLLPVVTAAAAAAAGAQARSESRGTDSRPRRRTARRHQVGGPPAGPELARGDGARDSHLGPARPGARSPTAGGGAGTGVRDREGVLASARGSGRGTLDADAGKEPRVGAVPARGEQGALSGRTVGERGGPVGAGGSSEEAASVFPALPPQPPPATCRRGPSRSVGAVGALSLGWNKAPPPAPHPEIGTRGSGLGGGPGWGWVLAALPRGPVGLRVKFLFQFSSCPPSGEAPVG